MVSTAHPIATEAGLEILRAEGNAFDAAIAIASTLNLVQPMISGIGGYGTIITYHAATKSAQFLNCSAHIPFGVDSDAYRAPTPNYQENQRGAKAVSTPGNVPAWEEMSRRYGSLDWEDLFAPAITVAKDGFVINERTAMLISMGWENFPKHAKAFYGNDDNPLSAGGRLIQTDLANSLRMIAKGGGRAMRDGSLALAVDQAIAKLAAEDALAAELVKLRYFTGLSVEQAALSLKISRTTAYRHWTYARAWIRCDILGEQFSEES